MMDGNELLRMEHIRKVYPNGVVANSDICFSVNTGEIHALSGENGAGKTTLMKILFGNEQPTSGRIFLNGQEVHISSSSHAIDMGIGMVHQHFKLVPSLTVIENMILGMEPTKRFIIDYKTALKQVKDISLKYNMNISPEEKIRNLTVSQKQKVEILKALFHGAKLLILDEPTAVLAPQETDELFKQLKVLKASGYTIIFISHKLNEIKGLCDRITIVRHGRTMGVYNVSEISETEISRLMVGRDVVLNIDKPPMKSGNTILKVSKVSYIDSHGKKRLNELSFAVREGEIFGVAGVEGNGQTELVRALARDLDISGGTIELKGEAIDAMKISDLRNRHVGHIPEDRMVSGTAGSLSVIENILSDKTCNESFFRHGLMLKKRIKEYGEKIVKKYMILCSSPDVAVSSLSGGNIQKVVLARELSSNPVFLIADQPTRGVDVGAAEFIRKAIIDLRSSGKSVFLVSSDLNELKNLSDRMIVLCNGEIYAYFDDAASVTDEELGKYMLGIERMPAERIQEVMI